MNKQLFSLLVFSILYFAGFAQAPTGLNGTAYRTTLHLQWDDYAIFEPVGFNIYRTTVSGSYGAPARSVGAYNDYTDYGLSPATTYYYKIAAFDKTGAESPLSAEIMVATDDNNYLKVANLDLLIPIYTGGMSVTAPDEIMQGLEFAREIFFRNSLGQLNLKFCYMIIDGYPPLTVDGVANFNTIGADLTARGILDNQYDAIHIEALKLYGWFGGALWLGQTAGSMAYNWTGFDAENHFTRGDAWVFTHEFGHSLDLIIAKKSGYPEMIFNHFAWAHPMPPEIGVFDAGENFDAMALVLRLFEHHLDYQAPYDGYLEVEDQDNDGLADFDARLVSDELRFGSNPNLVDTDNDDLDDLEEFTADVYQGSNPTNPDTDGDGVSDGQDIYPASNFNQINEKTDQPINVDGMLEANEGWNPMGADPFYSKIPGATLNTFTTWDDDNLYFAFQSNQYLKYSLLIDGNGGDGIFASPAKWPGGDYSSINSDAWGISYFDQASLIIRADDTQVYKKQDPLAGSMINTVFENGIYTTEVKLPHNLGPGFGHSYVYPNSPEITELVFSENDTLGIQLVATPLAGSNAYEWNDWRVKDWLVLDQPFHYYDMVLAGGEETGDYCDSHGDFPWHEWIAEVELSNLSHTSGKSTYSDFTSEVVDVIAGEDYPVKLTTGFSYFTWDEYWRIWIDFNMDGDFTDDGEMVFSEILNAPPDGTFSAILNGNINIPNAAQVGATLMRVSMKRGAFAAPCETLPFGEVEDYSVNISAPALLPNLKIPNYEVIPSNGNCFTNPGETFGYLGGTLLNSGDGDAGAYNLKVTISKDDQPSADDILWDNFQYLGLMANSADGYNVSTPVPTFLPSGKYFIIFQIDSEEMVAETDETDNVLAVSVNIGAPDFLVDAVGGLQVGTTEGSTLDVTAVVVNIAPFPLTELTGDLPISVYFSEDDGFSLFSDLEIGTTNIAYDQFSNGPLFDGGSATVNISAQLPNSITPGEYFIFVYIKKYCEQPVLNNISNAIPIQIEAGIPGAYCISYGDFPWEDWIAGVEIASLSNTSGKSNYSDFTSKVANVWAGQTYPVSLTTAYSYFAWDEYWRIWIDFNKDGDFTDPGEMVFSDILSAPADGTATAELSGNINIPANAIAGTTRMRVSMKRGSFASPCEIMPFGEVEDYTVSISTGCNITVGTGNLECQDAGTPNDPNDDTFTFEVLAVGTGVSQNWQMTWPGGSASGIFSVVQIVGPLPIADFPDGLDFTVLDNANSLCSTTGALIPPPPCSVQVDDYCTSASGFPWEDWIKGVKLNDLDNPSGKSTYNDFTHLSATLEKDVLYDIKLTTGYSWFTWDEYWSVWIDLNQDNVFQNPGELVSSGILSAPPNGTPSAFIIGNLKLPSSTLPGETRMRVVMKRGSYAEPCEDIPYGEIEDYTIVVVEQKPGQGTVERAANIAFEAVREKTWINLYGVFRFPNVVSQVKIEKSDDGEEYVLLELIPGNQTPDVTQLAQARDLRPIDGLNYYRLLFLLENGDEIYSDVRIIDYDEPLDLTIFPNPATDEIFVHLSEIPETEMDWTINDAYGRVVWSQKINTDFISPYRIDVGDLKPGMYYLFAQRPGIRAMSRRFVIAR